MFLSKLSYIINQKQSRSVILEGNVDDLFSNDNGDYVPLTTLLMSRYKVKPNGIYNGVIRILYEINSPIKILDSKQELEGVWNQFRGKEEEKHSLDDLCQQSNGNPILAMEFLRQLCMCARAARLAKPQYFKYDLLIIVEAIDRLVPDKPYSQMHNADVRKVGILHDWFSDPEFMDNSDSVIMIAKSKSMVHSDIAKLPQVLSVEIGNPDTEQRNRFILNRLNVDEKTALKLAKNTAGLTIHALRQLCCHRELSEDLITRKVEEYIVTQLGDAVEFKKPTHTLDDVVGFSKLKRFIREEMIPRILMDDKRALPGAAIGGAIGSGKTFIFEAMASELGVPVLVLKNLRSMWFGQTDVILEKLQRTIAALDKVVIFVDEADTQFGGVGENTHDTERRLTGKIQAMMSDSSLRGKVVWLLMTARINLLSPDIRRPGRVGDLIIPVLDPDKDDAEEFLKWMLGTLYKKVQIGSIRALTSGYSAAAYAALKSQIDAKGCKTLAEVEEIAHDMIPPDIGDTRKYQTLQAMLNCTRQSLMFDKKLSRDEITQKRESWKTEIHALEQNGVR